MKWLCDKDSIVWILLSVFLLKLSPASFYRIDITGQFLNILIMKNTMKESKYKASIIDDRPILVSQQEIAKRRRINSDTLASFAVDNIPVNPDTQHIFEDFMEGRIATSKEVKELLHAHYTKLALRDN